MTDTNDAKNQAAAQFTAPSTIVVFPTFIGGMTGIAYLRVGIRKVWVTLTDGQTLSVPRKTFPAILPSGNDLAFTAARIITDGESTS
ncbi:MAG: hypothetical protein WC551_11010 [Patescibacteria group bacterium]